MRNNSGIAEIRQILKKQFAKCREEKSCFLYILNGDRVFPYRDIVLQVKRLCIYGIVSYFLGKGAKMRIKPLSETLRIGESAFPNGKRRKY